MTPSLRPELDRFLIERSAEATWIPSERRTRLEALADYLRAAAGQDEDARLVFVCTHNSRRSQIAQAFAWALTVRSGKDALSVFSAGTEVTAVALPVDRALAVAGFRVERAQGDRNPVVSLRCAEDGPTLGLFSKPLVHASLPTADFCAVMTCSDADARCPVVLGATTRIALPYEDPKAHDGTAREAQAYAQCSQEIGRELAFAFARI